MGDHRLLESFLVSINSFSFGGVRFDVGERWIRNGSLGGMVWVRRCSFGYGDLKWQWLWKRVPAWHVVGFVMRRQTCFGVFGVDALIFRFGVHGFVVKEMMKCPRWRLRLL